MKIYTKTGDKGTTSIIGGTRIPKNDLRIKAYGTIDELSSFLGAIRCGDIDKDSTENILKIQQFLFVVGAILSSNDLHISKKDTEELNANTLFLEKQINIISEILPPLKSFIIPGSNKVEANCQIARTVCRRAERGIVSLINKNNNLEILITYINRLSDYLFVLARKFIYDFNDKEIKL